MVGVEPYAYGFTIRSACRYTTYTIEIYSFERMSVTNFATSAVALVSAEVNAEDTALSLLAFFTRPRPKPAPPKISAVKIKCSIVPPLCQANYFMPQFAAGRFFGLLFGTPFASST